MSGKSQNCQGLRTAPVCNRPARWTVYGQGATRRNQYQNRLRVCDHCLPGVIPEEGAVVESVNRVPRLLKRRQHQGKG